MALRKAIGTVKDQTSIGIAKVASQTAELKIAIVKATSHDADPANEKHVREILYLTSSSRGYVTACISTVSRRLGKTRNWLVALKSLILIHRLLAEGDPAFWQELLCATRRGTRLLNLSDFRDQAHSNSWDQSAFVRTYALYLDQKLDCFINDDPNSSIPLRDMKAEKVLARMNQLQRLLDRLLACRPTGFAKNCRMVYVTLYPIVKESFKLYGDICEVLSVLLDNFFDMEYADCVKAFEAYESAAKQIDDLVGFYNWCKDTGVARSAEFPQVQRITDKLLETLEEFVQDRIKKPKSPDDVKIESTPPPKEEEVEVVDQVLALPPPESYSPPPPEPVEEEKVIETDLVDLREDGISCEDQSNMLALALFQEKGNNNNNNNNNNENSHSAWEIADKADWELALVESVTSLSNQKVELGGGFDPLLLNGIYDQGIVRQHASTAEFSGGSASSVAIPGNIKGPPVLALPAPDGVIRSVGEDPFAASLAVPPPSYVQMADMEKKQQLLVQEQRVWDQYARDGMQGQVSLGKIGGGGLGGYYMQGAHSVVPYGMQPMPINGVGPGVGGGYYYATY